jgi:hypothetical protein
LYQKFTPIFLRENFGGMLENYFLGFKFEGQSYIIKHFVTKKLKINSPNNLLSNASQFTNINGSGAYIVKYIIFGLLK